MSTKQNDVARYTLWAALLITANAIRINSGLLTAWVFHAIGNSFLLLLPELYRALDALRPATSERADGLLTTIDGVMRDVVVDNPRYVEYVAPVAIAYLLSHPRFNIYKSEWANEQLFGFGLDSIPHAWTAFALTNFVFDTLASLKRRLPRASRPAQEFLAHPEIVAATVLALATLAYEGGEYAIHRSELKAVHNNPNKIAMEWSVVDTIQDIISNAVGGLFAMARYKKII